MPVMDGFEFLQKFSAMNFEGNRPVVIMLTTSSNAKDLHQVRQFCEVGGYFNKPLNEEKLKAIVQKHFSQHPVKSLVAS